MKDITVDAEGLFEQQKQEILKQKHYLHIEILVPNIEHEGEEDTIMNDAISIVKGEGNAMMAYGAASIMGDMIKEMEKSYPIIKLIKGFKEQHPDAFKEITQVADFSSKEEKEDE